MADPDLRFIGERLERVQAELRELRGLPDRMTALENKLEVEIAAMQAELEALRAGVDARFAQTHADIAALRREMHMEFKSVHAEFKSVHAHFKSIDAQFAQAHETMTTNFMVLLEAIKGLQQRR
jgi:predicted  nucleic acid-binding Zn-ribbon protein